VVRFLWVPLLLVALAVPCVYAAEPADGEGGTAADGTEPVVEEKPMTQGEFAVAIVRMLGLETELPPDATELDYAEFLRARGIGPLPDMEWDVTAEVTNDIVAVVVVQALGLLNLVEDRTKPEFYARVLEERGLILTNVRDVLSEIMVVNPLVYIWPGAAGTYWDNVTSVRGR
jgi:hypothetical protein